MSQINLFYSAGYLLNSITIKAIKAIKAIKVVVI